MTLKYLFYQTIKINVNLNENFDKFSYIKGMSYIFYPIFNVVFKIEGVYLI